jgi:hypothetical protein
MESACLPVRLKYDIPMIFTHSNALLAKPTIMNLIGYEKLEKSNVKIPTQH